MPQKILWALTDERQGNTSQTIGVAEALGVPFEVKPIHFSPLIRLPNLLLAGNTLGVTARSRATLTPPWPDMVIATARRLGLVASYIKYRHPECFLVQIQWPGNPSSQYDLIAASAHDGLEARPNRITTLGAPHGVQPSRLRDEATRWRARLPGYAPPFIAVLVGGDTRGRAFDAKHGASLGARAQRLAAAQQATLLVTTSRRTGIPATDALAAALTGPVHFHRWEEGGAREDNPFYGYLGLADAIIVTGDSVSMCSEACSTGKPVFIYADRSFISSKHAAFVQSLCDNGLARPLSDADTSLFTPPYALDDTASVVTEIKRRVPWVR